MHYIILSIQAKILSYHCCTSRIIFTVLKKFTLGQHLKDSFAVVRSTFLCCDKISEINNLNRKIDLESEFQGFGIGLFALVSFRPLAKENFLTEATWERNLLTF